MEKAFFKRIKQKKIINKCEQNSNNKIRESRKIQRERKKLKKEKMKIIDKPKTHSKKVANKNRVKARGK